MKTEKQIKDKLKQLEDYVTKGKEKNPLYTMKETKAFIGGLKYALDIEE